MHVAMHNPKARIYIVKAMYLLVRNISEPGFLGASDMQTMADGEYSEIRTGCEMAIYFPDS